MVAAPRAGSRSFAVRPPDHRSHRPRSSLLVLYLGCTTIAVVLLLPEIFLVVQASGVGWPELHRVLWRPLSGELLRNTVELAGLVTGATMVIGTAAAWCVERTNLPLRRVWAFLLVLPVAVPDFVVGYAWHSLKPGFLGLRAASVVMTLDLYPLVYLPVAAALRRTDPALEEASRALGVGPWRTFTRVIVPQVRAAVLGGSLLVTLALLAEFGAFEILDFRTFTTEIFTELQVDRAAAAGLSLILVALGILVVTSEAFASGRRRVSRAAGQATRPPTRMRLGRWLIPALVALTALVGLALALPVGTIIYWLVASTHTTLPQSATLMGATFTSLRYSAEAAVVATAAATPVALLAAQRRGRLAAVLERSTYLVQSVPGVVVALSLVFFSVRYALALYQTSALLVLAYALLFFPLALVCVRASAMQASPRLTEMGRSLGSGPIRTFLRVTVPIIAPGLVASFCLVLLSAVTELTATLVLVPTGTQTLATQFWAYQTNTAYGAAAPYAAMMIVIAGLPGLLVAAWFSKERGGTLITARP
jgi:iron(III) transport system permease protein